MHRRQLRRSSKSPCSRSSRSARRGSPTRSCAGGATSTRTPYNGAEVGVMHACGHDCHTAVLMGVAEIFAGIRDRLPGTIKLIFQPAEEGAPDEEPRPEAIFGLHVTSVLPTGTIGYKAGPVMASSDRLSITVRGRQ